MSVSSIQYAGNGNFQMTVDGKSQTFNLADLNTMLRMDQVAGYDQQIADQLSEIQQTNQKRKAMNQLLSKMRDFKARQIDDNVSGESFSLPGYSNGQPQQMHAWEKQFGLEVNDAKGGGDADAYDRKITGLKSAIDNITSDSEMQMLRFRQMVDKRGTALQEAKTTLTNDKRLKDAIIQG